jgi:uncharacterized protein
LLAGVSVFNCYTECMNEILIGITSGLLIIIGGIGSFLPILPGPPLSFAGLWLYAWFTNYEKLTPTILIVFAVLTVLAMVIDFIAPALGAKGYKASRAGALGSMIGAFIGVFVMGPIGIVVGPFVGGFIGEFIHAKNLEKAGKSAIGSLIGFAIGSLFKIAVIMGMITYFIYALF